MVSAADGPQKSKVNVTRLIICTKKKALCQNTLRASFLEIFSHLQWV